MTAIFESNVTAKTILLCGFDSRLSLSRRLFCVQMLQGWKKKIFVVSFVLKNTKYERCKEIGVIIFFTVSPSLLLTKMLTLINYGVRSNFYVQIKALFRIDIYRCIVVGRSPRICFLGNNVLQTFIPIVTLPSLSLFFTLILPKSCVSFTFLPTVHCPNVLVPYLLPTLTCLLPPFSHL